MGATAILKGIGRTGADVGTGAGILEQQRRAQLEDQFRKFQLQMEHANWQQRVKEQQTQQDQSSPAGIVAQAEGVAGEPLSPDERKRLAGVAAPGAKAKYLDLKPDSTGKMWGLNAETGRYELVPGGENFQAPKKSGLGTVDPIVAAQIGKPPDSAKFPQGENDPNYKGQMKLWGAEAEKIKTRMASATAEARGKAYGAYRPGAYITPEGELVSAFVGQAIGQGWVPAAPGFQAMSKQAQFSEIQSASGKLRSAIGNLQPGDAFSAPAVIQLGMAMNAPDAGSMHSIASNLMASGLNERQQDYVVWLTQMAERLLSIRNIAGMGQGAEDLRRAIQATLPNIASGTPEFALRRMDAVDNQISQLYRGIPKVSKIMGNQSTPAKTAPTDATDDAIIKALGGK